jgi:hypothetical protein
MLKLDGYVTINHITLYYRLCLAWIVTYVSFGFKSIVVIDPNASYFKSNQLSYY